MKRPINVQPEVKAHYLEIQMQGKDEREREGPAELCVSCRGKVARRSDAVMGPVSRHGRVAAAGNTAANHNITQKRGDESRKNMDGNKVLKVRQRCNVTCARADVI